MFTAFFRHGVNCEPYVNSKPCLFFLGGGGGWHSLKEQSCYTILKFRSKTNTSSGMRVHILFLSQLTIQKDGRIDAFLIDQ